MSAVKLSISQNASILYEKQTASVSNSKIPGVFSSLIKENVPHTVHEHDGGKYKALSCANTCLISSPVTTGSIDPD